MKIKLNKLHWNSDFTIETLKPSGTIMIYSTEEIYAGLGTHYNVTITTDKESYHLGDIGEISSNDGGLEGFFYRQMIEQNIDCEVRTISRLHYEIKFKETSDKKKKI